MIKNYCYYCHAIKTKCYIENGIIRPMPLSKDNMMQTVNAFEIEIKKSKSKKSIPLYSIFAQIRTEQDIIEFIEKYGFLGLHFEKLKFKNWMDFSLALNPLYISPYKSDYSESVEEFIRESYLMDSLLELIGELFINNKQQSKLYDELLNEGFSSTKLYDELDSRTDYSVLKAKISNVYLYNGRKIEDDFKDTSSARLTAQDLVCLEIEQKLKDINLKLKYSTSHQTFIENRIVNSLIESMYMMLYEDLTLEKRLAKCENPTCKRWFPIDTNHKQKYCDEYCERAAKQQRYRKNAKERCKQGGKH